MNQCLDKDLRSGDLLLFSGRSLSSWVIRIFTRSRWSHIGMVVVRPDFPEPLLLESTQLTESTDVLLGKRVAGVALVPLAEKVHGYRGEVAVRRRCGPTLTARQQRLLDKMLGRLLHRPYKNYVLCQLLDRLTGFPRRRDLSAVFCSELVAELYRRLGWLPESIRACDMIPAHFAGEQLRLCQGQLQPLEWVKRATASVAPLPGTVATDRQSAAHGRPLPRQSHDDQLPRSPAAA